MSAIANIWAINKWSMKIKLFIDPISQDSINLDFKLILLEKFIKISYTNE